MKGVLIGLVLTFPQHKGYHSDEPANLIRYKHNNSVFYSIWSCGTSNFSVHCMCVVSFKKVIHIKHVNLWCGLV